MTGFPEPAGRVLNGDFERCLLVVRVWHDAVPQLSPDRSSIKVGESGEFAARDGVEYGNDQLKSYAVRCVDVIGAVVVDVVDEPVCAVCRATAVRPRVTSE